MKVEYAPSATACRDETLLLRSVGDLGCSSALCWRPVKHKSLPGASIENANVFQWE
jgi:hypothetical protein